MGNGVFYPSNEKVTNANILHNGYMHYIIIYIFTWRYHQEDGYMILDHKGKYGVEIIKL